MNASSKTLDRGRGWGGRSGDGAKEVSLGKRGRGDWRACWGAVGGGEVFFMTELWRVRGLEKRLSLGHLIYRELELIEEEEEDWILGGRFGSLGRTQILLSCSFSCEFKSTSEWREKRVVGVGGASRLGSKQTGVVATSNDCGSTGGGERFLGWLWLSLKDHVEISAWKEMSLLGYLNIINYRYWSIN